MSIQSINPLTNKVLKEFEAHTDAQIEEILQTADSTYRKWRKFSFEERSKLMHKAANVLRSNKNKYAQIMTDEMGKTKKEAVAEVDKCALCCDYYANNAARFLADEPLEIDQGEAYIAYDPIGTVLAIMPWNFPYWQVIRFAVPTLMAGNVGILKHASNVPQCALALEEVFREAGFPQGCFQSLLIPSKKVDNLLADKRIKAATLTGSEGAGSKVAAKAGKELKKTVLELGGSDPFIVLADADIDKAASTAAKARMLNCGQSCIAAKRFIVVQEVYEQFIKKFKQQMSSLKQGDPNADGVDYGPMAREDLAEELLEQTQKSIDKGAEVLLGGDRPDKEGAFFNATILANVKPGMPAYEEELFGPVASVFKVKDEEEAILIANDSPYGLGGCVWTQDIEKGKNFVRQVESGAVYINKMTASHPALPFGGVKMSGYGRELSHLGIREFVNQKTVWMEK
ncbi:succinate-semialdehyde dehydrogenase/glutarate-semialdehyde dehydrogenase [Catalinimonas alkaloidigena]|uniref:NAD-dependent succinate-semialdehyde dehydrogenase n=1 Tax=Catalinimonas alkaloidigena TaxID=1075417 RepID=UPI0024071C14|nr:NAD-dependent succinate-semialdehyde dehydrogenase [Catalinimonas alkaloidigena]MDF9799446.1 succinate-semialdehyde dehydrogenase/glutarate-semialdehyde dehydrogenase [Catalinimonas alkaloidigena]